MGVAFETITERKQTEELVRNLAAGVTGEGGEQFFRPLVRYLAKSLGLDLALVGELAGESGNRIETIAMFSDGEIVENVTYDLSGTPCENVMQGAVCCYPDRVAELFPDDHMLADLGMESYVASPLLGADGEALGLIAVLGRRPLASPETATSVLQIFASRAAQEVERRQSSL